MEKKVAPDWCAIAFPIRVLPESTTSGLVRLGWVELGWVANGRLQVSEAPLSNTKKLIMKINARVLFSPQAITARVLLLTL